MNYTIDQLVTELDASTASLIETIQGLSQQQLNKRPEGNGWSATEVVDHLIKLDGFITNVLAGETKDPGREPGEHMPLIKKVFGNREQKLTSPESIRPLPDVKTADELISAFSATREKLKNILNTTDITQLCLSFKHRFFGELTRLEWAYFSICHTERHLEQIRNAVRMASGIIG